MKQAFQYLFLFLISIPLTSVAQQPDQWIIKAGPINPASYYGVTVANGMIGIVSSPEPLKVKNVVLTGVYDQYGRGRVSNFLNSFNLLNMNLDINGKRIEAKVIQHMTQELDMKHASFSSSFDYGNDATVTNTYYALRQLPYVVLMDVTIKAKKDITISAASVMEAPDALRDVQNYYNEIDRPHVTISLLTSTAQSPTGKLQLCSSTTFLFQEQFFIYGKTW